MANTKSAKGKVREISKKTEINKSVRNRYRTYIKKVELNIVKGNKNEAQEALKHAESEIKKKHKYQRGLQSFDSITINLDSNLIVNFENIVTGKRIKTKYESLNTEILYQGYSGDVLHLHVYL